MRHGAKHGAPSSFCAGVQARYVLQDYDKQIPKENQPRPGYAASAFHPKGKVGRSGARP